ncbi:hypothetical protein AVEN_213280-1 [Araneus ventricosus]|uniref:Uncharacterized protein n=1 Tax=Araneus ventricosus TaxID=182803 RepID=A0A4Y2QHX9_ARAVE|nr:hypothetical protein AVEN_213280-1 [Araneus ventricosus]
MPRNIAHFPQSSPSLFSILEAPNSPEFLFILLSLQLPPSVVLMLDMNLDTGDHPTLGSRHQFAPAPRLGKPEQTLLRKSAEYQLCDYS